jgi:flagellin
LAISIATNLAALRAQRQVSLATGKLRNSYEQLSTGSRINNARDDAAGLAISTSLRAQARIASAGIRNANDGISLTSIGNAALGEITNILTRMAQLAEQSATGTIGMSRRSSIQLEFVALGSEIDRIATTTIFNGITVLSNQNNLVLQVGYNSMSTSGITVRAVQGTLEGIRLASAGSNQMNYRVIGETELAAQANAKTALDAVLAAIENVGQSRGSLGADQSRLASSVGTLQSARENFEAADTRIRDVDFADKTTQAVKLDILQSTGLAILGQANQQPEIALRLLEPPSIAPPNPLIPPKP